MHVGFLLRSLFSSGKKQECATIIAICIVSKLHPVDILNFYFWSLFRLGVDAAAINRLHGVIVHPIRRWIWKHAASTIDYI